MNVGMLTAKVNHITRLRINSDGHGIRSVIFVFGCPLNCLWCCNPETQIGSDFKTLTTGQLDEYIDRDKPYFKYSGGGVTFSGGEPLMYSDFIAEYVQEYCSGFSVDIETSLFSDKGSIEILLPLINEWFVDFKVFDCVAHKKYTGQSNETIKDNLIFLSNRIATDKITVAYPVIPEYNTSEKNVNDMIGFLSHAGIHKVCLHQYRKLSEYKKEYLGLQYEELSEVEPDLNSSIEDTFVKAGFDIVRSNAVVEIRKQICDEYRIPMEIADCTYEGRCKGTCPKCESEFDLINSYLNDNKRKVTNGYES